MLSIAPDLIEWARHRALACGSSPTPCKICGAEGALFDVVDFHKSCHRGLYPFGISGMPVYYHRCPSCHFIFTTFFDTFTPEQWGRHVYNADYAKVDPDYANVRPHHNARELECFLSGRRDVIGVDYGGGNGLTAELMRGRGWNFRACDPFGHSDVSPSDIGHFNFCSAMEVLEHTPDPVASMKSIVEMCTTGPLIVFVGTGVHDRQVTDESRLAWWYAAPRNGHISLFSRAALARLGAFFGLEYTSITRGTHLLTRGISRATAAAMLFRGKVLRQLGRR